MTEARATFAESLAGFEAALRDAKLTEAAISAHTQHAARFIRWLRGEYRLPGEGAAAPALEDSPSPDQLAEAHALYASAVKASQLTPLSANAYIQSSSAFVRWTRGEYRPRGPNARSRTVLTPVEDDSWLWEGNVQARIANWLRGGGWMVEHVADTAKRERGVDMRARLGSRVLLVEVKGFPQSRLIYGEGRGQPRKHHASIQGGTYFDNALAKALGMRDANQEAEVAIGLPDVARYRAKVEKSRRSLEELGIGILFVDQLGGVTEHVPLAGTPPRELAFEVDGYPPAKGEALSMLGEGHSHSSRVITLLTTAEAAIRQFRSFKPFEGRLGLEVTLFGASEPPSDATNYLGGIGDVLEDKGGRGELPHLGALGSVAVYRNDRQIREVHYRQEPTGTPRYMVRIWLLDPERGR